MKHFYLLSTSYHKGGFRGGAKGVAAPLNLEKFLIKFWLVDKIITFFVIGFCRNCCIWAYQPYVRLGSRCLPKPSHLQVFINALCSDWVHFFIQMFTQSPIRFWFLILSSFPLPSFFSFFPISYPEALGRLGWGTAPWRGSGKTKIFRIPDWLLENS
jgi:hypothetical protein